MNELDCPTHLNAKASPESSQEKQVEAMQSQCYQILLIAEDPSRTQAYERMLQDAEDVSFEVESKTNWPSALSRLVSCAPDSPLPDAILWDFSASVAADLACLKDATALQPCVPFVLLVPENQVQLRKQVLETGVNECLVRETMNKDLLQMALRHVVERRQLENTVRQSQKLEAIGRLSGGLAHNFNNLLCVIKGHAELLTEALHPADPAIRSVAQIRKAAESAAALTRQLLALSRRPISPQVVDLDAIVKETEGLLARLSEEHPEFPESRCQRQVDGNRRFDAGSNCGLGANRPKDREVTRRKGKR